MDQFRYIYKNRLNINIMNNFLNLYKVSILLG